MPRMTLVRYATKPEHADENDALSRAVYDELRAAAPPHIAYATFRNGADFVHVLINSKTDSADAVIELPSFKTYLKDIGARCAAPPETVRVDFELIGAYGLEA